MSHVVPRESIRDRGGSEATCNIVSTPTHDPLEPNDPDSVLIFAIRICCDKGPKIIHLESYESAPHPHLLLLRVLVLALLLLPRFCSCLTMMHSPCSRRVGRTRSRFQRVGPRRARFVGPAAFWASCQFPEKRTPPSPPPPTFPPQSQF